MRTILKNPHLLALLSLVLLGGAGSDCLANQALAKKNECLGCHAAATKLVGTAYQSVAEKYAGQADAKDVLVQSIIKGSVGKWGDVPMPPHPTMSEADAKRLATWVLGGAK